MTVFNYESAKQFDGEKHVSIPDGVTSIEKVGMHCDWESVTIPNSVETIEMNAFRGCM